MEYGESKKATKTNDKKQIFIFYLYTLSLNQN